MKLALVGNPNSGKSSLFNNLTGLRQKVGNYPGVTVERKYGRFNANGIDFELIDLPGSYSLYPHAQDEFVVSEILSNPDHKDHPSLIIAVSNINQLERQLLILSQVLDLHLPTVLVLTMVDEMEASQANRIKEILKEHFNIEVFLINNRNRQGIDALKEYLSKQSANENSQASNGQKRQTIPSNYNSLFEKVDGLAPRRNYYQSILYANHLDVLEKTETDATEDIAQALQKENFKPLHYQVEETLQRYEELDRLNQKIKKETKPKSVRTITDTLDNILTHPLLGPFIFGALMLLVFQSIFEWASIPMDFIDGLFAEMSVRAQEILPAGWFSDLISEGIIPGIAGVVIFIPQIAILFLFLGLLEEMGYMSRVVYMFDRVMQSFGLNGRSLVALISSGACAIPAIMSARTIANPKERLTTIMVSPLISCSARIPVYIILIAFVVPNTKLFGIVNQQAAVFGGLYLLSIVAALVSAFLFSKYIGTSSNDSYLAIELPEYKNPNFKNVFINVYEKVKSFIIEAGKVILVISIVLWFASSYGMPGKLHQAEQQAIEQANTQQLDKEATSNLVASERLEASFAGQFGKMIEPVIRPLGYDWKIGIGLLTSFAAREVFVGTLSTIYSVGDEEPQKLREKMRAEINPNTGKPTYTIATSLSLLVFFLFAMQCMSTLAVVKKETKSWKWPIIQLVYMTGLAYGAALLVYQLFS